jgi:hypothetical protein
MSTQMFRILLFVFFNASYRISEKTSQQDDEVYGSTKSTPRIYKRGSNFFTWMILKINSNKRTN